ncbi:uncharacterized protein SPSK_04643 [Sporothrix schenckii 1099-18]|uniref:Uncharacterized protein n=1 Tax=Sporothrix schenckii 1099-18 TaxID=1397361 RepID=A0A0F2M345_SPOSC|nr:uncharacterized protein SPSK_04643 [Sporothrix schenckii 1099-18]KJR83524.1 hypothetical protein SPSK_04643 [Sporothrix schenckii 1099-18]
MPPEEAKKLIEANRAAFALFALESHLLPTSSAETKRAPYTVLFVLSNDTAKKWIVRVPAHRDQQRGWHPKRENGKHQRRSEMNSGQALFLGKAVFSLVSPCVPLSFVGCWCPVDFVFPSMKKVTRTVFVVPFENQARQP